MKALCAAMVAGLLASALAHADNPAKNRPSIKDEKSKVTVGVKEDDRTLSARDKDGKVLWEVDVIKKAGAPAVGKPVVRDLALKDGKVTAVYGKHSFADFDLKTGKLLASGSD